MARVASGDVEAFEELYDRFAPRVYGLIRAVLGDAAHRREADDVLQETFLKAWRTSRRFDPERASVIVWLCLIARSTAVDALRSRRRADRGLERLSSLGQDAAPAAPSTEGLPEVLLRLPAEQRGAIVLAFFRGLTHEEIARSTGEPLGTVKTRIRLGMGKLRDIMVQEGGVTTP